MTDERICKNKNRNNRISKFPKRQKKLNVYLSMTTRKDMSFVLRPNVSSGFSDTIHLREGRSKNSINRLSVTRCATSAFRASQNLRQENGNFHTIPSCKFVVMVPEFAVIMLAILSVHAAWHCRWFLRFFSCSQHFVQFEHSLVQKVGRMAKISLSFSGFPVDVTISTSAQRKGVIQCSMRTKVFEVVQTKTTVISRWATFSRENCLLFHAEFGTKSDSGTTQQRIKFIKQVETTT